MKYGMYFLMVLFLYSCGGGTETPVTASELKAGQKVIAQLAVVETETGMTVKATGIIIETKSTDEEDGEDIECEDGLTPDGQPCVEGAEDGSKGKRGKGSNGRKCGKGGKADKDGDDIECEDGLTPDGQPCVEEVENEGEGEDDCKNENEQESEEMIAAPITDYSISSNPLQVLGIYIDVPAGTTDIISDNYRFIGKFEKGTAHLQSSRMAVTKSSTYKFMTIIDKISKNADGTLTMELFGKKIIVDSKLIVKQSESIEQDVEGDVDDIEDVDCQQ